MFYNFRQVVGYGCRYLITDGHYAWDQVDQKWLNPGSGGRKTSKSQLPWEHRQLPMKYVLYKPDGIFEKRAAEGLWVEAMSNDSSRIVLNIPALPPEHTIGRLDADGKNTVWLSITGEADFSEELNERLRIAAGPVVGERSIHHRKRRNATTNHKAKEADEC